MKSKIEALILEAIGEDIPRQEVLVCTHTQSMDSMCGKCVNELNVEIERDGYNQALAYLRSKVPELAEKIEEIINNKE